MPNEYYRSIRHSLKLTFRSTESGKLTGSVMVDDGGKLGGWTNRDFSPRYIFYLPGYSGNKKLGAMGYLSWTHSLSARTFYEVKGSQLNRTSEFGYSDDDNDGFVEVGEDGDFIVLTSSAESDKYLGVNGSAVLADGRRGIIRTRLKRLACSAAAIFGPPMPRRHGSMPTTGIRWSIEAARPQTWA